ncbi:MAG: KpsF/GutQ family sugar-phosphate isomerase [Bacteriovoracaceae bacterium]|nr:KpsF/GutQ family sugar-phosphate isomerase [Bacteriovoracaceae bacterium]
MMNSKVNYTNVMKQVLELEASAIQNASERLSEDICTSLVHIFEILKNVGGSLVFCGVGKSGIIAHKIASTFSSLGLPSFFLHPVEAQHGDLGRVRSSDAVVFLSKSGTTVEIMKLLPFLPVEKSMRIALLGNVDSPIAHACEVVLDCSVDKEACINNQAPTTSSTLALAMGDALAVLYESLVGLSQEGFAVNHPGGILGKSLLMKVQDLMWKRVDCPTLGPDSTLSDVILEMTSKPVGACAVVDNSDRLLGIMVEGDIRRTFMKDNQGLKTMVADIMTPNPVKIGPCDLAYDALSLMEKRKTQISTLPVVQNDGKFMGFIRLHDLLREGFLPDDAVSDK